MSNYVHLRIEYYPRDETRKTHAKMKVDADKWDNVYDRRSYVNGVVQVAGGRGSRIVSVKETRRTKT